MDTAQRKVVFNLILSCWLTYTLSICLKMAYGASMTAVKEEYLLSSDLLAGLPITLYYLTYAVIQLFLAAFVGKIDLKRYLLFTCLPAGLLFVSVFVYSPFWYLNAVMAIDGVLLGAVWCGCMQLFKRLLPSSVLDRALLFMGAGFSAGSALSFGISALAMKLGNWRFAFLIIGSAFLLALFYMLLSVRSAEAAEPAPEEPIVKTAGPTWQMPRASAKPLIVMAAVTIFIECLLYYGFSNWMPTILKSNFDLAKERATLISILLPVVTYVGPVLAKAVGDKFKNDFASTAVLSAFATVPALILSRVYHWRLALTVAVIVLACVFLRAVSTLLGTFVSVHVSKYVNAGSSVAVINSFACVAAAASPLLVGAILDATGRNWTSCFLVLFALSVLMLVIPLLFMVIDKYRRRGEKDDSGPET